MVPQEKIETSFGRNRPKQVCSLVVRFGGKAFCCYLFKTNFGWHNTIWGGTKIFQGTLPPNAPVTACLGPSSRSVLVLRSSKAYAHGPMYLTKVRTCTVVACLDHRQANTNAHFSDKIQYDKH